jgi:hypothetical protein
MDYGIVTVFFSTEFSTNLSWFDKLPNFRVIIDLRSYRIFLDRIFLVVERLIGEIGAEASDHALPYSQFTLY